MKKNGFTLAEILITMSIVGVVSALTIPSLVSSYKKDVWGTSLAKAVNAFSNACSMMIIKDGADGIFDTKAWVEIENGGGINSVTKHLGKSLTITETGNGNDFYSGLNVRMKTTTTTNISNKFGDYPYYKTKNNITYLFRPITLGTDQFHEELDMVAGDLIIDVNGKDSPNIFGRDIFGFLLNNDGRLIPYGDTESLHITDKVKTSSLGDTSRVTDNWKTSCSNAVANNGGPTCTAKVVNEGYKINY